MSHITQIVYNYGCHINRVQANRPIEKKLLLKGIPLSG